MEDDVGDKGSAVFDTFQKLVKGQDMPEEKAAWVEWFDGRIHDYEREELPKMHIPEIVGEAEFEQKLAQARDKLVIIKFWKHKCLPCLSYGPFMKRAEQQLKSTQPNVEFYSVDIKRPENIKLSGWQRVMGTPTVQYFHEGRQVGENVEELSYPTFMDHVLKTASVLNL
eukprot:EG_transcript_25604